MLTKIQTCKDPYTPCGSKIAPIYSSVFDEEKKKNVVKKTGEFDIDEFIQASATHTDLALLRQQMASTGQIPVIDDEVIDETLFPENIHDLMNTVNTADSVYKDLPEPVRKAFKNKDEFLAALVDGTYQQKANDALIAFYNAQQTQQIGQTQEEGGNK